LASLSNINIDSDDSTSSLSDNESEREVKDKVNRLCFLADSIKEGFCGMVLHNGKARSHDNHVSSDDSHSEVQLSANELVAELDTCNATLLSQDKLLKHALCEQNEYKAMLECALKDLEFSRSSIVTDEMECDSCGVHMSNFSTL
jgi:hypothetical protein